MREMKDSGIKWIGVIPSAWRTARVKNVAETMQSGGTPDSSNDTFYVDIEGGIPWVAIADMSTTPYVKDTNKHISEEGRKSKNLIVFEPGRRGCGQNLGLIMQQSQDDVYTQSDSVRRETA